jgi:phage FluMu protein Com
MTFKFVKASDDDFVNPICPFCRNELNEIKVKYLKNPGNVFSKLLGNEVGMAYFCPSCKSLLGITNRVDPV